MGDGLVRWATANLFHGPEDIMEVDCPLCPRKAGEQCVNANLEDAGPFFHRERFDAWGCEPKWMDGGEQPYYCPQDINCEHWFDGTCRLEKCSHE